MHSFTLCCQRSHRVSKGQIFPVSAGGDWVSSPRTCRFISLAGTFTSDRLRQSLLIQRVGLHWGLIQVQQSRPESLTTILLPQIHFITWKVYVHQLGGYNSAGYQIVDGGYKSLYCIILYTKETQEFSCMRCMQEI